MGLTSILSFLCSFSLICVSLSEFVVVEVQLGGEVSLLCSNLSNIISNIFWFKSGKRSNTTRIASMPTAESNVTVLEDFRNGRFHMSSNTTHVFLNIKDFNISDSGLYFCGLNTINHTFDATFLQVEVSSSETPAFNLVVGILGSVIFVLVMVIISLLVKIKSFQRAPSEHQHTESLESNILNYAALTFQPKSKTQRGPGPET
uniref:Novel immune-type receptor 12 isoform 1 n=1 Tax=Oryzias latipes TaxID=8090 RepID=B3TZA4_ORYLA|nr:novel immune-type receptor 12 precursor [Oryzias latipes]ACB86921.1 novel immune-type receptor 12 isoform 1 [Oryzias latipes]